MAIQKTVQQNTNGFALLLSIIISSIVLAIGVSLLHLSISQINLASTARESEIAFQAAHAGANCAWFWRYNTDTEDLFATALSGSAAPTFSCFGDEEPSSAKHDQASVSGGTADTFDYEFPMGTAGSCTQVTVYVMRAGAAEMTWDLRSVNEGIGTNGIKKCDANGVCTIIVSRGYNRNCADIATSIFTIQRELTVEF